MVTAGGLLSYADGGGASVAADATNGKLLWQFNTNERWRAGPMTYTVEGNQYIGVAAGTTILVFSLRWAAVVEAAPIGCGPAGPPPTRGTANFLRPICHTSSGVIITSS